ncbi:MAG: peptidoglycan DD-metalloendopeptidase family protein [Bacteriovoracaceae bacterium]|nr:peptidoglycan DD-metalloendopeptidase family protein [Bacteriovoracaceae bacterium]
MKFFVFFLFSFVVIVTSCSHMRSGQYVKFRKNDTLEKLASEFKVKKSDIQNANQGKSFGHGKWVFIPLKRGIMGQSTRWGNAENPEIYLEADALLWPVPSSKKISSGFGRRWGRPHEGIDISARKGSHILAAQSGVIVYSGDQLGGYGKITVISHKNGFFTVYAHAQRNFTKAGDRVHRGQVIAQVGSTGRSTGPHLHFEVRRNSKALNPLAYLSR